MHSTLRTPFWQAAYASLPKNTRERYLADIEHAERLARAVDAAVDGLSRLRSLLTGLFKTPGKPRPAH